MRSLCLRWPQPHFINSVYCSGFRRHYVQARLTSGNSTGVGCSATLAKTFSAMVFTIVAKASLEEMHERHQKREAKLREQCDVVASMIIAMRPVYETASVQQRALLETIVGAAIWYIPKPVRAWTGQISHGALKAFHPERGHARPRLSEEHVYPRKVAARILLSDIALTGETMAHQFREKYGRVHLITPEENKAVQRHQRVEVFNSPDEAYALAGISLIELPDEALRKIKKRDRRTIELFSNRDV
jgi:hypothetical protein